jgi:hypothetical protein
MDNQEEDQMLHELEGLSIESVEVSRMSYDGDGITHLTFKLSNGRELTLRPTSFNYGSQYLMPEMN